MNSQPAGPSGNAGWVQKQAGSPDGTLSLLLLPDAAAPNLYYALPETPWLAHDGEGRPIFSLSLVLSERPGPEADTIFPLVQSGALTCDLTLALPASVLTAGMGPLFTRLAEFKLYRDGDEPGAEPLGAAEGSGAGVRVGLSAQLDQAAAQGVLKALNGAESGLTLACRATYRVGESRKIIHLNGHLLSVYNYLDDHAGADGSFCAGELQALLLELAGSRLLRAWTVARTGLENDVTTADGPALLAAFLKVSQGMLRRTDQQAAGPAANLEPCYVLGASPNDAMTVDIRMGVTTAGEQHKDLAAPLEAILGSALAGLDADAFIHLAYVEPRALGGLSTVPRRIRSAPASKGRFDSRAAPIDVIPAGDSLIATTRALAPNTLRLPPANVLLETDAVSPQAAHTFVVADLMMQMKKQDQDPFDELPPDLDLPPDPPDPPQPDPPPHLPIVDNPAAPLWADAADRGFFWYGPQFSLAPVDPSADPDSSNFRFTFHEAGHDSQGRAILEGEVLFTLQRDMSAETAAAIQAQGNPPVQEVPVDNLSVTLSLPVRDDAGGMQNINLQGTVAVDGTTVTVRVAMLNEYVRVAYGDLAIAGFQPSQAQLKIAYSFPSAQWSGGWVIRPELLEKIALVPVVIDKPDPVDVINVPYLNAQDLTYRTEMANVAFRKEAVGLPVREDLRGNAAAATGAAATETTLARSPASKAFQSAKAAVRDSGSLSVAALAVAHDYAFVRPEIAVAWQPGPTFEGRWIVQSVIQTAEIQAFFPCNTLGAFYRQELEDRRTSIGCQESFSLGQTPIRLFELVDDAALASPHYKVYRSLSQPGRFMVLPTAYLITRYAAGEGGRAYRPVVYLYSSLDPDEPTNNRCVVIATLEPDLPPWMRKEMEEKLARLHHSPVIQYVTEMEAEVQYTWSLVGGPANIQPQATRLWDSFQVSLATDLAGGLQLQGMLMHTGVAAQASFRLADGSTVSTDLNLDLNNLTGPWENGPLQITVEGTTAALTNRIERGVNVSDLVAYTADGASQHVRVDCLLAPGESTPVALPFAAAEVYPVMTLQAGGPATLTEIDSFVENIHTNIVFVNLIRYTNHNLRRLDVQARLREVAGSSVAVAVSEEQPVGQAAFTLPLTTYLGSRTLQFQVTKTDNAGAVTTTPWLDWDLARLGNVISLTWELIA